MAKHRQSEKNLVGETTLSHIRIHRVSVNEDYDFIPKRKKGKKHVHVVLKNDQLLPRNEKVVAWRPVESLWLHRPPFDHSLRSFCWVFWGCHLFFVGSVFPAWVIVIWMKKQNLEDLYICKMILHSYSYDTPYKQHFPTHALHDSSRWMCEFGFRSWKGSRTTKGSVRTEKPGEFFSIRPSDTRNTEICHVFMFIWIFFFEFQQWRGGVSWQKIRRSWWIGDFCPFIRTCQLHFALKNFHLRWFFTGVHIWSPPEDNFQCQVAWQEAGNNAIEWTRYACWEMELTS